MPYAEHVHNPSIYADAADLLSVCCPCWVDLTAKSLQSHPTSRDFNKSKMLKKVYTDWKLNYWCFCAVFAKSLIADTHFFKNGGLLHQHLWLVFFFSQMHSLFAISINMEWNVIVLMQCAEMKNWPKVTLWFSSKILIFLYDWMKKSLWFCSPFPLCFF